MQIDQQLADRLTQLLSGGQPEASSSETGAEGASEAGPPTSGPAPAPVSLDELQRLVVQWVQGAVARPDPGPSSGDVGHQDAVAPSATDHGNAAGDAAAGDAAAGDAPAGDAAAGDAAAGDTGGGEAAAGEAPHRRVAARLRAMTAAVAAVCGRWRWTGRRVAVAAVTAAVALAAVGWWVEQRLTALPSDAAFAVGGQVVTTTSYDHRLAVLEALYGMRPPGGAGAATFRRAAAQAMVIQLVMGRAAARQGIRISHQAASKQLQADVTQQYGTSGGMSAFDSQLGSRGLSEGEVLQAITAQLQVQKLFDRVVGTVHVISAQVQHLYATHQAQLAVPETRSVSHIVVATKSAAEQVLAQLRSGTPFAALAAKDSLDTSTAANGGALGTVSKAELDAPFGTAAFAAAPNVPFGPVHDQYGWEVGLVTQVVPGHPTSLSQARTELQDYLKVTTEQARWDRWLRRQLVASGARYAPAYRPAHPDQPPVASVPTLGPPGQVGSLAPAASSPTSGTGTP